jgi:hypothetical protein
VHRLLERSIFIKRIRQVPLFSSLDRWKTSLTSSNKQSFGKIFYNNRHLVNALYYTYYWIVQNTDGYALRHSYSRFLNTAGQIIDEPLLLAAGGLYEKSGLIWRQIAKSPGLALLRESVLTEELDACAKHEWGNE